MSSCNLILKNVNNFNPEKIEDASVGLLDVLPRPMLFERWGLLTRLLMPGLNNGLKVPNYRSRLWLTSRYSLQLEWIFLMPLSQFNWSVFWAVLCALLAALGIYGLWGAASTTIQRWRAKLRDPNYLIHQAFQGKKAFKPAAPLDEHTSVEELKREYSALRDLERATSKTLAISTRDDAQASRDDVIDAAVNAFTAGGITEDEMHAMINEANRRLSKPIVAPSAKPKDKSCGG